MSFFFCVYQRNLVLSPLNRHLEYIKEKCLGEKKMAQLAYYNKVIPNRVFSSTSRNTCDYDFWKDNYIHQYKINITETVSIISDKVPYTELTIGNVLNLADESKQMQLYIKRICMKNSLSGKSPLLDLKNYLEEQLRLNNTWLIEKIS